MSRQNKVVFEFTSFSLFWQDIAAASGAHSFIYGAKMLKTNEKPVFSKPVIPQKLFYKIGEVSRITNLEPYVLRYWETEFPFLKPRKGKSGQRIYQRKDIDIILEIKRLLYEERFTIEGVRKNLSRSQIELQKEKPKTIIDEMTRNTLHTIKNRLKSIVDILNNSNGA